MSERERPALGEADAGRGVAVADGGRVADVAADQLRLGREREKACVRGVFCAGEQAGLVADVAGDQLRLGGKSEVRERESVCVWGDQSKKRGFEGVADA